MPGWKVPAALPEDLKAVGVVPLWLDASSSAPFETDTLPLLYAPEDVYHKYYQTLISKSPELQDTLRDLEHRNNNARKEKADGNWEDCLDELDRCLCLRLLMFPRQHWQVVGAARHLLMTTLSFAEHFTRQARTAGSAEGEQLHSNVQQLFARASVALRSDLLGDQKSRRFFRALVASAVAQALQQRGKYRAAAQQARSALRQLQTALAPSALDVSQYFMVRAASSCCFTGEWGRGITELREILADDICAEIMDEEEEDAPARDTGPRLETFNGCPLCVRVVVRDPYRPRPRRRDRDSDEDSGEDEGDGDESTTKASTARDEPPPPPEPRTLPVLRSAVFAAQYNLGLALMTRRKHQEAATVLESATKTAASLALDPSHFWIGALSKLRTHCADLLNPDPETSPRFILSPPRPIDSRCRARLLSPEVPTIRYAADASRNLTQFWGAAAGIRRERQGEWDEQRKEATSRYVDQLKKTVARGDPVRCDALGYKLPPSAFKLPPAGRAAAKKRASRKSNS
eukprot:Hpha_TRINITY_DN34807_c0_g1::TRINITY_DN34807_c0_g1_i1::g.167753::m.167753